MWHSRDGRVGGGDCDVTLDIFAVAVERQVTGARVLRR